MLVKQKKKIMQKMRISESYNQRAKRVAKGRDRILQTFLDV